MCVCVVYFVTLYMMSRLALNKVYRSRLQWQYVQHIKKNICLHRAQTTIFTIPWSERDRMWDCSYTFSEKKIGSTWKARYKHTKCCLFCAFQHSGGKNSKLHLFGSQKSRNISFVWDCWNWLKHKCHWWKSEKCKIASRFAKCLQNLL